MPVRPHPADEHTPSRERAVHPRGRSPRRPHPYGPGTGPCRREIPRHFVCRYSAMRPWCAGVPRRGIDRHRVSAKPEQDAEVHVVRTSWCFRGVYIHSESRCAIALHGTGNLRYVPTGALCVCDDSRCLGAGSYQSGQRFPSTMRPARGAPRSQHHTLAVVVHGQLPLPGYRA